MNQNEKDNNFDLFWARYPHRLTPGNRRVKLGKAAARKHFPKAVKDVGINALLHAVQLYARCEDERYVKDAFRWLRDKGYEDDYDDGQVKPVVDVARVQAREAEEKARRERLREVERDRPKIIAKIEAMRRGKA